MHAPLQRRQPPSKRKQLFWKRVRARSCLPLFPAMKYLAKHFQKQPVSACWKSRAAATEHLTSFVFTRSIAKNGWLFLRLCRLRYKTYETAEGLRNRRFVNVYPSRTRLLIERTTTRLSVERCNRIVAYRREQISPCIGVIVVYFSIAVGITAVGWKNHRRLYSVWVINNLASKCLRDKQRTLRLIPVEKRYYENRSNGVARWKSSGRRVQEGIERIGDETYGWHGKHGILICVNKASSADK